MVRQLETCAVLDGTADLDFPAQIAGDWYVLHTKSRQEKALAEDLTRLNIACYLPVSRIVRFYGHRKAFVRAPMFPGYVFLRGTIDEAYRADRTRRIASVLIVRAQEQLDWELRNIHRALMQGAQLDFYPYLRRGVRVQVRSGPFRGLQGVIEERGRADRLILRVETLGRALSLEIDSSLLDRID